MFKEEARWLANIIYSLNPNTVFPILNIGSSNQKFREHEQPWIDELLFKPARTKGYSVIHADMKNDTGVDLVGDLCDLDFLQKLSEMNIQSVLCSNLLEHITNREEICQIISSIIPKAGYIFVTVPYKYPYHRDPIDTMFRPDIQELSSLFPDFKIVNWRNSCRRLFSAINYHYTCIIYTCNGHSTDVTHLPTFEVVRFFKIRIMVIQRYFC